MGISIWQLLIVLGIVILLFGTKKLRNIGTDLGGAIRGFKKSMTEDEDKTDSANPENLENKDSAQFQQSASDEKTQDKT